MVRVCLPAVLLLCTLTGPSEGQDKGKAVKLEVKQEGKDVVATAVLTINNSPVVVTQAIERKEKEKKVVVKAVVIQNSDLFVRSQKKLTLRWRLKDTDKEGLEFVADVERKVTTTKDLPSLKLTKEQEAELTPRKK